MAGGRLVAEAAERATGPECGVELTEVRSGGETWWSLGFEATGPGHLLRGGLIATATLVFAQPVPTVEPGTDDFASYMQWLARAY